jgi:hypothetical protein
LVLPDLTDRDEHFEVTPEAWPVVELFLRLQTQWRAGSSGIVGLDYGAVQWIMDLYQIDDQRMMLEDLQVIEAKVVEIVNCRKD